jgi:hypothetical protein
MNSKQALSVKRASEYDANEALDRASRAIDLDGDNVGSENVFDSIEYTTPDGLLDGDDDAALVASIRATRRSRFLAD